MCLLPFHLATPPGFQVNYDDTTLKGSLLQVENVWVLYLRKKNGAKRRGKRKNETTNETKI